MASLWSLLIMVCPHSNWLDCSTFGERIEFDLVLVGLLTAVCLDCGHMRVLSH